MEQERKKIQIGTVVSDKMAKTRVITVQWKQRHPLYQRLVRKMSRFMAHDEKNESHRGDRVRIIECRPMSKGKRWRIIEILQRAEQVEVAPEEVGASLIEEFEAKGGAALAATPAKRAKAVAAASVTAAKVRGKAAAPASAAKEEAKPKRVRAKKAEAAETPVAPAAAAEAAPKAEKKPRAKKAAKEPEEKKA